jgi:hypothetical protein
VAVNGTQKTTNNKSAAAKLMMSTFVVERIVGFAATTEKKDEIFSVIHFLW